jgi:hypothetical protein
VRGRHYTGSGFRIQQSPVTIVRGRHYTGSGAGIWTGMSDPGWDRTRLTNRDPDPAKPGRKHDVQLSKRPINRAPLNLSWHFITSDSSRTATRLPPRGDSSKGVGLVVLSDEARDVLEEVLPGLPAIRRRRVAAPSNEILRSITIALIMVIQQALDDPAHRARRVTQRRRRRREH